jgi:hypothetical protein
MDQGRLLAFDEWSTAMHAANYQRLLTWLTVGAYVEHGMWSVYGARLAVYLLQYENFDFVQIRDYDWFKQFFESHKEHNPAKASKSLGKQISQGLGWILPDFDSEQSTFIKMIQLHPSKPLSNEDVEWQTNLSMFGWFNG